MAEQIAAEAGAPPLRLAAGDTEHDRLMLAGADRAWVPAGSELARSLAARAGIASAGTASAGLASAGLASAGLARARITRQPGHAAAAQITSEWLAACLSR